jgi:predicted DNA-binding antitoxin AbrB/MazE fold protein
MTLEKNSRLNADELFPKEENDLDGALPLKEITLPDGDKKIIETNDLYAARETYLAQPKEDDQIADHINSADMHEGAEALIKLIEKNKKMPT